MTRAGFGKRKRQFSQSHDAKPDGPGCDIPGKGRKKYRGYVANVEEAVDSNGSVIVDYQFEQNIYSDSQFLQDRLAGMEQQEEGTVFVTDGAYCGESNTQAAQRKTSN